MGHDKAILGFERSAARLSWESRYSSTWYVFFAHGSQLTYGVRAYDNLDDNTEPRSLSGSHKHHHIIRQYLKAHNKQ